MESFSVLLEKKAVSITSHSNSRISKKWINHLRTPPVIKHVADYDIEDRRSHG